MIQLLKNLPALVRILLSFWTRRPWSVPVLILVGNGTTTALQLVLVGNPVPILVPGIRLLIRVRITITMIARSMTGPAAAEIQVWDTSIPTTTTLTIVAVSPTT